MGVRCTLPVDEVLGDRHCTCTATTLCRHLLRSILAYQAQVGAAAAPAEPTPTAELPSPHLDPEAQDHTRPTGAPPSLPWNPGQISDADLALHFRAPTLTRLRREFEAGQVIEVVCGLKPMAQLHTLAHTIRFLVPYELHYTYCDCADPSPCKHVPLAIWAFRRLAPQQTSGIISTEPQTLTTPTAVLDQIEAGVADLLQVGLRGLSPAFIGRLERLVPACEREGLLWPADILAAVLQACDHYRNHDARFSPEETLALLGDLALRCHAIRNPSDAIPQLFLRGNPRDNVSELGATRLIGLGCGIQPRQHGATLSAYFQDIKSGTVLVKTHDCAPSTQSFADLAQAHALSHITYAQLGVSQILMQRAKTSPNAQLHWHHAQAVVNPQSFQWEKLRSPLLVDDFSELRTHLQLLPPMFLRSRRLAENFYVFQVDKVDSVEFVASQQAITATLYDPYHHQALLYFPYTHQSHVGTETLLPALAQLPLRFVAGEIALHATQIVITPVSLVFQLGQDRKILQPWIYAPSDPCDPFQVTRSRTPSHRLNVTGFSCKITGFNSGFHRAAFRRSRAGVPHGIGEYGYAHLSGLARIIRARSTPRISRCPQSNLEVYPQDRVNHQAIRS